MKSIRRESELNRKSDFPKGLVSFTQFLILSEGYFLIHVINLFSPLSTNFTTLLIYLSENVLEDFRLYFLTEEPIRVTLMDEYL